MAIRNIPEVPGYLTPTLGSTSVASGETVTTIAGLTLTSPTFTGTVTIPSGVASTAANAGYMGLPQVIPGVGSYDVELSDAGKHIYLTANKTVIFQDNSYTAMPIGTTITIIAGPSATVSIMRTTDAMYLAGTGNNSGLRTLAPYGMATAVKITSTSWIISGNGLS
jgi:hypothetical protein